MRVQAQGRQAAGFIIGGNVSSYGTFNSNVGYILMLNNKEKIKSALLNGIRASYRFCEVELGINHPYKVLQGAINELESVGYRVKSGQNINNNTGKVFKTWRVVL